MAYVFIALKHEIKLYHCKESRSQLFIRIKDNSKVLLGVTFRIRIFMMGYMTDDEIICDGVG